MLFHSRRSATGLSVVAIFYNMRREAERTLYSLSRRYQQVGRDQKYEVCVIDNGSRERLSPEMVRSFGEEFHYHYVENAHPSPCVAINQLVRAARFGNVMILIDGARILSPGIVNLVLLAFQLCPHLFIYTFGMHLGPRPQNFLVAEGYDYVQEDKLLASVDWKTNGYSLFRIASPALSSKKGFFSELAESNCFAIRRDDFVKAGLYESGFKSPGGGLCNLELFNRMNRANWIQPIMLLGEATFHQVHGGVATNVPLEQHPWDEMKREYLRIVGEPYQNKVRPPLYFGSFREECAKLYNAIDRDELG